MLPRSSRPSPGPMMMSAQQATPTGPYPPPPYRAPPPALYNSTPPPLNKPYSKFNISEPSINQHVSSRHNTIENGHQVQSNLRNLLASAPKHSTLDGQGQNMMLQHLRNSGIQDGSKNSYTSPDNLRDAATRMFSRNQQDRSSFGGIANSSITQQFQHQMNLSNNDSSKRHSYSNQSFRKAMEQQKIPPQVPPKPKTSRTSNNDENEHVDAELKHIMKGHHHQRLSTTPPLPALSPGPGMLMLDSNPDSSSPDTRPARASKNGAVRPDLIGEADQTDNHQNGNKKSLSNGLRRISKDENLHLLNGVQAKINASMTQGALDIEKAMASVAGTTIVGETSDDNNDEDDGEVSTAIDLGDANAIRQQLDGLETMYSEVLKLLGLRKFGRPPIQHSNDHGKTNGQGGLRRHHKMYGSMSSLPSVSSIGSRHLYSKGQKGLGKNDLGGQKRSSSGARGERSQNKRFQRLESHVVTLARSVAHLSSEVRNQQIILQEVEALRLEVQQLRQTGAMMQQQAAQQHHRRSSFFHNPVSPTHANRVKKLTKFFGDEPPLLRLFFKNLGYEKYASVFEEAKIGMLELPYLSEDRLEKLGVPMGPRMRILQEARASLQATTLPPLPSLHHNNVSLVNTTAATASGPAEPTNYNVYIL